jgi:hypothetical protein
MSRDHRSLYSATEILALHNVPILPGGRLRDVPRRLAGMDTVIIEALKPPPWDTIPASVLDLVQELDRLGADVVVRPDIHEQGPCERCQVMGAVANVRIYDGGLDYDLTCRGCAPARVGLCVSGRVEVEVCAG